jgi:hypothetical protein
MMTRSLIDRTNRPACAGLRMIEPPAGAAWPK